MEQSTIGIGSGASEGRTPAVARDLAELARWGRLAGRLDARWELLRGPRAELTHAAAFGHSTIWTELDEVGRRVFDLAYFQAWTEWMASHRSGVEAVTAR